MMHGYGFGMGTGGWIAMLLFWGLLILGAVLLIRALFTGWMRSPYAGMSQDPGAREILDRRYARGEIGRDEYDAMKKDLVEDR